MLGLDGPAIRHANRGDCRRKPIFITFDRERKLNTNLFFSNFSLSQQNPGISRPKSLISLVSRDISNFLAPTRSRGRPLPHWKISGPKSLGLGSFFFPDACGTITRERSRRYDHTRGMGWARFRSLFFCSCGGQPGSCCSLSFREKNCLKPAIPKFWCPKRDSQQKKGFSSGTLRQFARIGPSKMLGAP